MSPLDARAVDEPVEVVGHQDDWTADGEKLLAEVGEALGALAADVQHIGSTAVPGLPTKPIIDLAAAVAVEDHDTAADRLVRQGFIDLGEADLRGRRYLRRRQPLPAANVHLMTPAGVLWIDNLVLRDYLRAAPKAARVYGDAKAAAAREHPTLLAYSQAKADFLRRLLQAAHAWEEEGRPKQSR